MNLARPAENAVALASCPNGKAVSIHEASPSVKIPNINLLLELFSDAYKCFSANHLPASVDNPLQYLFTEAFTDALVQ